MAQLFTVYFPKYYFDLQKEFSLELTFPLPFEYIIEDGGCYVSVVHYSQDNSGDPYYWQNKGLQVGLRVISINNKSLIDDYNNENDNINPDTILNEEAMEDLLAIGDTEKFTIQFREEISPQDCSIPLTIISNSQISASSYQKGYEPSQCRFNNTNTFWQPLNTQNILDTWLRIDLGMKKMITKLLLQGSPNHSSYIKSFWIDYSNDCCQWKCHPLGEIKCKYKQNNNSQSLHVLLDNNNNKNNSYATIMIWPSITARFIRIRPCNVHDKVAIRLQIYGFKQIISAANLSFARVVTLYDVNECDRNKLMEKVRNLPTNTAVIQVDCYNVISAALDRAGLTNVGFLKTDDNNFISIFTTSNSEQSERVLDELSAVGVGREMGVISTTAIAFRNECQPNDKLFVENINRKESTFSDSVKSRMIVKQVVQRIMNSSKFTFDYICMLIVASMIAVSGLATDNSVIVVASMLVSPLMGPVLAFTFGVTLKEINMAKIGLKNELLSLIICVITGFIIGFFYAILSQNVNNWPTEQMSSRGNIEGLADGAFIAAASGVGVALSVLGDYLSTVVGVAISASLLPPAVNCGMLFSFSIYAILYPQYIPINKRYINKKQLLKMAGWSLLLTIENIIIIFVVSRLMFYIKNVYITKNHNNKIWKYVTNFQRSSSSVGLMTSVGSMSHLNENMRHSFRFAMDSNTNILKGSLMINKHKSVRDNMTHSMQLNASKKQTEIALQIGSTLMQNKKEDNIGNHSTHTYSNVNGKKKHVSELFTSDVMNQYGYDMHSINTSNDIVSTSNDRFQ